MALACSRTDPRQVRRGSVLCPFAEKRAAFRTSYELRSMHSHGLMNHIVRAGMLAPRHKQRHAACDSAVALLGLQGVGVLKHTEHTGLTTKRAS
eukprot:6474119-Amphidinium_carterae.1